jgi:hypothetical protein
MVKCEAIRCVKEGVESVISVVSLGDPLNPIAQDKPQTAWLCKEHADQFVKGSD